MLSLLLVLLSALLPCSLGQQYGVLTTEAYAGRARGDNFCGGSNCGAWEDIDKALGEPDGHGAILGLVPNAPWTFGLHLQDFGFEFEFEENTTIFGLQVDFLRRYTHNPAGGSKSFR